MQETTNNSVNPAKRLLAKLKSPFLCLASELLSPNSKPHIPVSQQSRHIAMETESLSGGRLELNGNSETGIDGQKSARHPIPQTHRLGSNYELNSLPSQWFQKRKRAAKEIMAISAGHLVLAPHQLYYHGDDRSHLVTHIKCGYTMKIALSELRIEGPHICPLCDGGLFSRLNHVQINDYIFNVSDGQVLFIKNQLLGHTGTPHTFFHLACKQPFSAEADYVIQQNRKGISSGGCCHCEKT